MNLNFSSDYHFMIGQIISVIALLISVIIAQFKNVKHILLGEIASNLAVAFSFVFLGGLSGAWICIVAALQSLVIYFVNKVDWTLRRKNLLSALFAFIYIIGTVVVYQGWADLVSCACSLLYILAIIQTDSKKYRWFMAANSFLWVIYDINTAAYVNIITHGILLVSILFAMVRLDREKH